jgi:GNAT superfamily N-acetyltransferase
MDARRVSDPREFYELLVALAGEFEARHNLIFGISGRLVTAPDSYDSFHMWIVEEGGVPVGAALMTPPWNLVLADELRDGVAACLATAVRDSGLRVPGASGNRPTIDHFVAAWTDLTDRHLELVQTHGVLELDALREIPQAQGAGREVTNADRDLLIAWIRSFADEALAARPPGAVLDMVDRLLRDQGSGAWLWEKGGVPLSLSAFGGRTPNGIRIGPVFTPPEHRGRGYATSLVAEQSAWLLSIGHRFCFLHTDLANSTSNAIFQRLGYEQVTEAAVYRFID